MTKSDAQNVMAASAPSMALAPTARTMLKHYKSPVEIDLMRKDIKQAN